MSADKLASFRVDSQLWEQFQAYAKENNTNASALLISYIKSVVNTGNVITSSQNINTSSQSNNPSLSIQDIDKRIDDKVKQSIQNIDTLSIQDIDNRIKESLADGDIGGAIANSYKAAMGQFGGLLEELQALQKQLEELQSNPPAPPAPIPQLPITNDELIELLVIGDIARGQIYNFESLKEDGIIDAIKENQGLIEGLIGDNLTLKNDLSDMNKILKFMGFEIERTTKDSKKYNRAKMPK
jgi:hypothetical protein